MKNIVAIITLLLLIACGPSKKTTGTEGTPHENVPEGKIQVPNILSINMEPSPLFCVTLSPDFTYISIQINIYNRWGEKLWTGNDTEDCWDGMVKQKGETVFAPSGVYFVSVEIQGTNGKWYKNSSTLTVIQ